METLALIRETGIKLNLPINIILDAAIFARRYFQDQTGKTSNTIQEVLISATLYLSSKINEHEGKVRIRDFLNVAIYSIKEALYIENLLKEYSAHPMENGVQLEIEDGIYLISDKDTGVRRVLNDYQRNQFKFAPSTQELSLFSYYKLRDEVFKLEQTLIRLVNFQMNSVVTPALNELLLLCNEIGASDYEKQFAVAMFNDSEHLYSEIGTSLDGQKKGGPLQRLTEAILYTVVSTQIQPEKYAIKDMMNIAGEQSCEEEEKMPDTKMAQADEPVIMIRIQALMSMLGSIREKETPKVEQLKEFADRLQLSLYK